MNLTCPAWFYEIWANQFERISTHVLRLIVGLQDIYIDTVIYIVHLYITIHNYIQYKKQTSENFELCTEAKSFLLRRFFEISRQPRTKKSSSWFGRKTSTGQK